MKEQSDFGKGFIYNLVLFAKHFDRVRSEASMYEKPGLGKLKQQRYALFFNAASDHLKEMVIPERWAKHRIGTLARSIQKRSLMYGHGEGLFGSYIVTQEDFEKIHADLDKLALLIDKEFRVVTIKAQWN